MSRPLSLPSRRPLLAFKVQGRSEEGSTTSSFVLARRRKDELQLLCFRVTSEMSAEVKKEIRLEIAHVLFIDIVGYTKLLINDQKRRNVY
jgi:hypothetical protein